MAPMNHPSRTREEAVLRVLAGHESTERAALRLGVTAEEIRRWCDLARLGSELGQAPRRDWRPVALGGLALLLVASTWARVALAAPCNNPSGWPAGMIAFCPETPALAAPVNTNFAYLSNALKTKFSSSDLNASPGAWVGSTNIKAKQLTSTHLTANLFSSIHLGTGSLSGPDFAAGTIQQDRIKQTKFYKRNPACRTTPVFVTTTTCISSKTNDLCPPGLGVYYLCDSSSNKTGCQNAPPAACSNILLGASVSP